MLTLPEQEAVTARLLHIQDVIRNESIVRYPLNFNKTKELAEHLGYCAQHLLHTVEILKGEWHI